MDPIYSVTCTRCGHSWYPKSPDVVPTQCPKCKSPYWSRERKTPKEEGQK